MDNTLEWKMSLAEVNLPVDTAKWGEKRKAATIMKEENGGWERIDGS